MRVHLACIERLVAFGADHHRIECLAADLVLVQQRAAAFVHHVNVAPVHDRHQDRIEVETLLRQDVLVAFRAVLVGRAPQHAEPHELLQAVGEQVAGDAELRLKFLEAADAEKAVAKNQQAPAVTDHRERAGDGARFFLERVPLHSGLQMAERPGPAPQA